MSELHVGRAIGIALTALFVALVVFTVVQTWRAGR